jgi:hypothetical protein
MHEALSITVLKPHSGAHFSLSKSIFIYIRVNPAATYGNGGGSQ